MNKKNLKYDLKIDNKPFKMLMIEKRNKLNEDTNVSKKKEYNYINYRQPALDDENFSSEANLSKKKKR